MARNIKERRENKAGIEMEVQKLSLGKTKPQSSVTITLVGTVAVAGTGANSAAVSTGGVASKVFTAEVDGTVYYIPLFSSNA